jgi:hypothetical protein
MPVISRIFLLDGRIVSRLARWTTIRRYNGRQRHETWLAHNLWSSDNRLHGARSHWEKQPFGKDVEIYEAPT